MPKVSKMPTHTNSPPNELRDVYLNITLSNGPPWGFAIGGGCEFGKNLVVNKVTENGSAAKSGLLKENDEIVSINGTDCTSRSEAIKILKSPHGHISLKIRRKVSPEECHRFKGTQHDNQRHSFYETVYEEMLGNIDNLSTSYSERRNSIREGGEAYLDTNNCSDKPSFERVQAQANQRSEGHKCCSMPLNLKENVSPNRIVVSGDKELMLNIDLKTGKMLDRSDVIQQSQHGNHLEIETRPRNSSPIGVQKVTVKSVNVGAVHPRSRDPAHSVVPNSYIRSDSGDIDRHARSQDGMLKGQSMPRSAASMDNIPLSLAGHSQTSPLSSVEKPKQVQHDYNMMDNNGVQNVSNMNVQKAKALFEEKSRSTENLLNIGKPQAVPNLPGQPPRHDAPGKKEVLYAERNNNYTKGTQIADSGREPKTDFSRREPVNKFTLIAPQHSHTRSLPVEYEENGKETSRHANTRPHDSNRRPKSAHYLLDETSSVKQDIQVPRSNNQAHLLRSFRSSRAHGRIFPLEYGSGYEGDEENDSASHYQRRTAIRRSVEDLRYLPNASAASNTSVSNDGMPRSLTVPADEMREAAKRYHELLLRNHPSSFRYSFGTATVEPPRVIRTSSLGSRSRSDSTVSVDEPPTMQDDQVFKSDTPEYSCTSDTHLPQAKIDDSGNSILSRLLRDQNVNSGSISLGKIEEESQGNRRQIRKEATISHDNANQKPSISTALIDRETTVKTVAVSSTNFQTTTSVTNGGERGSEFVQAVQKKRQQGPLTTGGKPHMDDFVSSAVRRQSQSQKVSGVSSGQSAPLPIPSQKMGPMIISLDHSPNIERKTREYHKVSKQTQKEVKNAEAQDNQNTVYSEENQVIISHDKEPSTDSTKELQDIEEAARREPQEHEDSLGELVPDLESFPPPPDELLAESPPEKEKPQRTINRKKRDPQAFQSSSRNSSCVSTDSTTSTATADSGIGMRPVCSTDSSPRTSPLTDNHTTYTYATNKEGQAFKGSQEISDEDEGMPADPPDATSTPDRTDTYSDEVKAVKDDDRNDSPITDTPGSSAPNSRPGSASFFCPRFEELDTEKSKLIESMREKIHELKQQEQEITDEINTNEVLGNRVRCMVEARAKQTEFSKYELFIGELNNIVALLLSLTQRLHRYELMLQDLDMSDEEDKLKRDELVRKIDKLKNQHEEACRLRDVNDRRGENVANFLEKYCTEEEYADFQYYVDMKSQLALMQSEIKEKVKLGEERLKALECTGLDWS